MPELKTVILLSFGGAVIFTAGYVLGLAAGLKHAVKELNKKAFILFPKKSR